MSNQPYQPNATPASAGSQPDIWERWGRLWTAVFYGSLLLPLALTLGFDSSLSATERFWVVLLSAALAVWHAITGILYPRRRPDWRERPWITSLFLLVSTALWVPLARIDTVFGFTLAGLFSQVFFRLPALWAVPASLILSVIALVTLNNTRALRFSLSEPTALIYLVSIGFALLFYAWIVAIINQSVERKRLIEELQETQASLARAEREAGILEERQRLAREIHDTLAQGFASIVMHLEAAEQGLAEDVEIAYKHLDLARRTARDSLEQARRVVQDLRPQPLDEATLPDAIERTVSQWANSTGVAAEATCTGVIRTLHPDIETTLLRAVQEALANVRKHSDASRVDVTLSYFDDVVVLDVQDNGTGPSANPAAASLSGGYGLQAMRERAGQLHGSLLLETVPGEGTTLVLEIPVTPERSEETRGAHS
ncbi:MAG: sensor histidine kinase [Caldilineales bacterium]